MFPSFCFQLAPMLPMKTFWAQNPFFEGDFLKSRVPYFCWKWKYPPEKGMRTTEKAEKIWEMLEWGTRRAEENPEFRSVSALLLVLPILFNARWMLNRQFEFLTHTGFPVSRASNSLTKERLCRILENSPRFKIVQKRPSFVCSRARNMKQK